MITKRNKYVGFGQKRYSKVNNSTSQLNTIEAILKKLETFAKHLTLLSLFLYTSGLLVVNIYLSTFNMNDFYLLESKYLMVGALFLFYSMANLALYFVAFHLFRKKNIVYGITCGIAGFIIAVVINEWLFGLANQDWEFSRMSGLRWHLQLLMLLAISIFFVGATRLFGTPNHILMKYVHRWMTVLLIVSIVVGYFYLYSNLAFPFLPDEMGGGEMKRVELILTSESASSLQQVGMPFQVQSPVTQPILVIFEASNDYILALPERGNVLKLDKDVVLGVKVNVER